MPKGPLLKEILRLELRDVRDRYTRHSERAAFLRAQLARAERRAAHWRQKQGPLATNRTERVAAMTGELQLLELCGRLRARLAEQTEALRALTEEERELVRRVREGG